MVDQFVHQLTIWYFDDRSDPRAIQVVQMPGTLAVNRCKTLEGCPRRYSRLESIDAPLSVPGGSGFPPTFLALRGQGFELKKFLQFGKNDAGNSRFVSKKPDAA